MHTSGEGLCAASGVVSAFSSSIRFLSSRCITHTSLSKLLHAERQAGQPSAPKERGDARSLEYCASPTPTPTPRPAQLQVSPTTPGGRRVLDHSITLFCRPGVGIMSTQPPRETCVSPMDGMAGQDLRATFEKRLVGSAISAKRKGRDALSLSKPSPASCIVTGVTYRTCCKGAGCAEHPITQ